MLDALIFSLCFSAVAPHWRARRRPPSWDVLWLRRRWPPRLVFATPQDRVVLDLCHLAFLRLERGSLPLLRARHLGDGEQDSVLRPHLASPLTLSPNSRSSASVADFVPASPNEGNTVSRVRTVVLVNTSSSFSVVAEGCNFDAVRHPPVPTNKNSLQSDGAQTSSTHCGMFQFYRKRQTTPGWPRTCSLSLGNKSHSNTIGSTTSFSPGTGRLLWL